jgi:hypothetical protein
MLSKFYNPEKGLNMMIFNPFRVIKCNLVFVPALCTGLIIFNPFGIWEKDVSI